MLPIRPPMDLRKGTHDLPAFDLIFFCHHPLYGLWDHVPSNVLTWPARNMKETMR